MRKCVGAALLVPALLLGGSPALAGQDEELAKQLANPVASLISVPVSFLVSQVAKLGDQLVQFRAGARYWLDSPAGAGPEGWGFKLGASLLYPRG